MIDPTRTTTLRKAYVNDFIRRWNGIRRLARLGVSQGDFGPNGRYQGFTPQQQAVGYGKWLGKQMEVLTGPWQKRYIHDAYKRGINNAELDLRRGGQKVREHEVMYLPIHVNALNSLYQQAYVDQRFIENMVVEQVVNRMTPALATQQSTEELAELVDGRVRVVGSNRSRTLVNTVVVTAVAWAVLNRLTELGVDTVTADIESQFVTVGDARVCPLCQALATADNGHGPGIYTVEQARGIIPVHGGCRCTWRPRTGRKR